MMRKIIPLFLLLFIITTGFVFGGSNSSSDMGNNDFLVGVDNAGERLSGEQAGWQPPYSFDTWWEGLELLGVDFISYHFWPGGTTSAQINSANRLCNAMEERGMKFLLNLEFANWREEYVDGSWFNWVKRPDGNHGFNFKEEILEIYVDSPVFLGVIYDEAEHMLINRHRFAERATGDFPFLAETTGLGCIEKAYKKFVGNATEMVDGYIDSGVQYVLAEHVFPIMHPFAEAGFIPTPKLLKETWAPVMASIGMGAAIQYGTGFWVTPDLWDRGTYPGHSPEELRSTLLFGYWIGADKIYVENYNYKGDSLVKICPDNVELTPYGEVLAWFTKEYVPQNYRDYTFRDLKPEVAIIRLEDTDWGQAGNYWDDWLYGAKDLHSSPTTRNWLKIWHLLSHGEIPYQSISWNHRPNFRSPYQDMGDHYSFVPVNNVVVFDHKVSREHLETLELAFLTGVTISEGTLDAVDELVEEGLIVIADPSLVYDAIKDKYTGETTVINQGSGQWVLTEDVFDNKVKDIIEPFLGPEDEIRYVLGDKEVIFKIEVGSPEVEVLISNI